MNVFDLKIILPKIAGNVQIIASSFRARGWARGSACYASRPQASHLARVVKLVDTGDLKSPDHCDRAGSSPAPGTTILSSNSNSAELSPLAHVSLPCQLLWRMPSDEERHILLFRYIVVRRRMTPESQKVGNDEKQGIFCAGLGGVCSCLGGGGGRVG